MLDEHGNIEIIGLVDMCFYLGGHGLIRLSIAPADFNAIKPCRDQLLDDLQDIVFVIAVGLCIGTDFYGDDECTADFGANACSNLSDKMNSSRLAPIVVLPPICEGGKKLG